MKLSELNPNPKNPRKISDRKLEMLKKALEKFGDLGGFVYNRRSKQLVGGHQRAKVFSANSDIVIHKKYSKPTKTGTVAEGAVLLNGEEFKYREVDWSENIEKAANIAANKGAGEWEDDLLAQWMKELSEDFALDLDLTMFDELERGVFLKEPEKVGLVEDDALPEKVEPRTKLGDIYELGNHRLLCADSTSIDAVEKLMGGEKADMVFTDPPYNLGFKYNKYDDSLSEAEYQDFCRAWYGCLKAVSNKIIITPGTKNLPMWMQIDPDVQGIACWVKKNWMTSCKVANLQQWEPIIFYGPFSRTRSSDLFEINKTYQKDVGDKHTCPKQIELLEDIFNHYGENTILDIFGGSGSTLIACEKTNRKCFMMELDPHYCDVIVTRWENFTGKKAKLLEPENKVSAGKVKKRAS